MSTNEENPEMEAVRGIPNDSGPMGWGDVSRRAAEYRRARLGERSHVRLVGTEVGPSARSLAQSLGKSVNLNLPIQYSMDHSAVLRRVRPLRLVIVCRLSGRRDKGVFWEFPVRNPLSPTTSP